MKNNKAIEFSSPVNPAPAAPNKEAMMAIPAAEPRTAAPPAPNTAPAPAATKGAARPPVTPNTQQSIYFFPLSIAQLKCATETDGACNVADQPLLGYATWSKVYGHPLH